MYGNEYYYKQLVERMKEFAATIDTKDKAVDQLKRIGLLNEDGSLSNNFYTDKEIIEYNTREVEHD